MDLEVEKYRVGSLRCFLRNLYRFFQDKVMLEMRNY